MKIKKKHEGNSERWLLTYSDLITLLMILFILLYAMSNVNQTKYEQLASSLNKSLGNSSGSNSVLPGGDNILPGGGEILPGDGDDGDESSEEEESEEQPSSSQSDSQSLTTESGNKMQELNDDIDKIINENDLNQDISTNHSKGGLIITFPSSVFFDSGNAVLKDNMKRALDIIADKLNEIDNDILVRGYTDNVPIKSSVFSSNWQLSAIRAANVVQYLIEHAHVDGTRLMAVGCGENNPVATNDTSEGRNKNRRIEMVILFEENMLD